MNEVYIGPDYVLAYGTHSDFLRHQHLSQHIIIGLDGKIECIIENESIFCDGVFIDGMKTHTISNSGTKMLVFMIDDSTCIAQQMKNKYPQNYGYYLLPNTAVKRIKRIWRESMKNHNDFNPNAEEYPKTFSLILQVCNIDLNQISKRDPRIEQVIHLISKKNSIEKSLMIELAKEVYLSPSRLSHLFKKETGVSLRNYLLLTKLRKTYIYLMHGYNASDAAIQAGFSSLSHFITINKKWFGMSFKQQKKHFSKFIEIQKFADDISND